MDHHGDCNLNLALENKDNEEGKLEDDPFSFKKGEETIASLTDYACNFKENCDRIKM